MTDSQPTQCADCGASMREEECACLADTLDYEDGVVGGRTV